MAKPTFHIDRSVRTKLRWRSGYTLVEAMLASVLLSVTVVAISGAISASYAQETYAADRHKAMKSGQQLLDEVVALPIESADVSRKTIMMYNSYADEMTGDESKSVTSTSAAPAALTNDKEMAKRQISVQRMSNLSTNSAAGDFAVVSVDVRKGDEEIKIKRLVTKAEADATR